MVFRVNDPCRHLLTVEVKTTLHEALVLYHFSYFSQTSAKTNDGAHRIHFLSRCIQVYTLFLRLHLKFLLIYSDV